MVGVNKSSAKVLKQYIFEGKTQTQQQYVGQEETFLWTTWEACG